MNNVTFDLRDLLLRIKEQKQIDAELTLEFDCVIETEDVAPLVKVINYAINYITRLSEQPLHISLNATMRGYTIGFTAFTTTSNWPEISPKVNEALNPFNAVLEQKGEPGKYAHLLITFTT